MVQGPTFTAGSSSADANDGMASRTATDSAKDVRMAHSPCSSHLPDQSRARALDRRRTNRRGTADSSRSAGRKFQHVRYVGTSVRKMGVAGSKPASDQPFQILRQ